VQEGIAPLTTCACIYVCIYVCACVCACAYVCDYVQSSRSVGLFRLRTVLVPATPCTQCLGNNGA
jgi:hypothetical protein